MFDPFLVKHGGVEAMTRKVALQVRSIKMLTTSRPNLSHQVRDEFRCSIFLCCLDGEIYYDPYRNQNMNNKDHRVG